jgi:4-diphosphocytidyl-2-C-methyl-D-erythritol kinase
VQIRHHANWAHVLAPAKINLFFAVIRRRDDGFHEIETLMTPIGLFDTLVFEDDPTGAISLQASWAKGLNKRRVHPTAAVQPARDLELIPEGDQNIVVRAVRLLAQTAGVHRGAKLRLVKRIPSAAGLGGGSSDAAATLLAANRVWNLGWSVEQLAVVAAQLGSDVPFFLAGGTAICRGRGEKIEPIEGLGAMWFVVVRPPEGLSTAAVYGACRPGESPTSLEAMVTETKRRNWPAVGPVAFNGLLPAAKELSPRVGQVLKRLEKAASPLIGMSGSGTSCFAVARNGMEARRLARRLQSEGIGRAWAVHST